MLRKIFIIIILLLIISTTYIKNYTKKLDEKIFEVKENINYLISIKELVQLENDYLSSPSKLLDFYNIYFDNELNYTLRKNIEIINDINQINFEKMNKNEQ
tara:strand:+ start:934 stop:1236 length:303 start_codon:yes stop_codon:yes gene_type:complete